METTFNKLNRPMAVITGASSGIGYELAKVFAKNNFDLLVIAEDDGIAEAGNAFRQFGGTVETLQADLASYEGVEKAYAKVKSLGTPVDSLVLNAGVGVGGKFIETDLEEELNMIRLNVLSTIHFAKRVLQDMSTRGQGRILFTSSLAAEMPGPYYAIYAATKSFIQSFAEAIRSELADTGSAITITALQPGATETNFFARAHLENTKAGEMEKDDPAEVAQQGFDALMSGADHVVAGSFKNKVQAMVGKFVYEKTGAKMQGMSVKPKESH